MSIAKDTEPQELWYTTCVNCYLHSGIQFGIIFLKLSTDMLRDPASPLLGIYPAKFTCAPKDIYKNIQSSPQLRRTQIFSIEKEINTFWHTNKTDYHTALKMKKQQPTWMDLANIMTRYKLHRLYRHTAWFKFQTRHSLVVWPWSTYQP